VNVKFAPVAVGGKEDLRPVGRPRRQQSLETFAVTRVTFDPSASMT
jgi:hypothetical protein